MNPPNTVSITAGRANQYISSIMREKLLTKAVKQPALLFLILIPFPFVS